LRSWWSNWSTKISATLGPRCLSHVTPCQGEVYLSDRTITLKELVFTTHADMATTAKGLKVSPWAIALVLGIPFAFALCHFFAKILPDAEPFLFPESLLSQQVVVLLTTYLVFVFFGNSGIHGYGSISHRLSVVSAFILFPVVRILCWPRRRQRVMAKQY
jgi:hypothetical protein